MSPIGGGPETSLGGGRRDFPQTRWSLFLGALPPGDDLKRELAQRYWKPVYLYIRSTWAKSNEDAKDLAQDFFVWMFDGDFLKRPDPARGRFRALLKVALKHYLATDDERRRSLKRGGGRTFLPIEDLTSGALPEPTGAAPEEELDAAWRNEIFAEAASRLERSLRDEGREIAFRVFREFHLKGDGEPSQRDVARRHGISEADLANHLKVAKRRLQQLVADLVAETVQDDEGLRAELRGLFGMDP